jgi:hypothetical protein
MRDVCLILYNLFNKSGTSMKFEMGAAAAKKKVKVRIEKEASSNPKYN